MTVICFKTHGLIISMKQTSGVQDKPTLSPRKGHRKTRDVADASLASRGHRERYASSEVKAHTGAEEMFLRQTKCS